MSKGIYKYADLETGDIVYIGKDSRIDIGKRHKRHLHPSAYDEQHINRIIQNNPGRYEYSVIWETEDCSTLKLNKMEILFGKIYNPKFNFGKFGSGGCSLFGADHPNYRDDLDDDVLAKEYFDDGLSTTEIAEKYNCDAVTVSKRLRKNGYKLRYSGEARNTSGYFRVYKNKNKKYKQGFIWMYSYYDENNKHKSISSISLDRLKEKIISKGLEWREL